jgi:ketosteroid isomerase-like protein
MDMRYIALAPFALLAACAVEKTDPQAALDEVRKTEQAQIAAIQAKNLDGAVGVYDANATLIAPGGGPTTGAAAIRGTFQALLADPNLKIDFKQGPGWASGDLAVTTATGSLTTTDAKTHLPATTEMDVQTVWHKDAKSEWKIVSDFDVARAPAPAPAPAP